MPNYAVCFLEHVTSSICWMLSFQYVSSQLYPPGLMPLSRRYTHHRLTPLVSVGESGLLSDRHWLSVCRNGRPALLWELLNARVCECAFLLGGGGRKPPVAITLWSTPGVGFNYPWIEYSSGSFIFPNVCCSEKSTIRFKVASIHSVLVHMICPLCPSFISFIEKHG